MFCEEKNLSVRRKIFKVWRRKKCKCRISGVRKKWKLREKFRKKKWSVLWDENLKWEILLSSYPLVRLYVYLQIKVTEKNDKKFSKYFSGRFEVKIAICLEKVKLVGRRVDWKVQSHELKFEVKDFRCSKKLKLEKCSGRGLPR